MTQSTYSSSGAGTGSASWLFRPAVPSSPSFARFRRNRPRRGRGCPASASSPAPTAAGDGRPSPAPRRRPGVPVRCRGRREPPAPGRPRSARRRAARSPGPPNWWPGPGRAVRGAGGAAPARPGPRRRWRPSWAPSGRWPVGEWSASPAWTPSARPAGRRRADPRRPRRSGSAGAARRRAPHPPWRRPKPLPQDAPAGRHPPVGPAGARRGSGVPPPVEVAPGAPRFPPGSRRRPGRRRGPVCGGLSAAAWPAAVDRRPEWTGRRHGTGRRRSPGEGRWPSWWSASRASRPPAGPRWGRRSIRPVGTGQPPVRGRWWQGRLRGAAPGHRCGIGRDRGRGGRRRLGRPAGGRP